MCPSPNLSGGLEERENCDRKKRDEICRVACKRNSKMIGRDFLTCLQTGEWSSLPKCDLIICSQLNIPDYLAFNESCVSKLIGEFCRVKCKGKRKLLGNDKIECLSEHAWNEFPNCTCPALDLYSTFIETKENCDSKKSSEQCKIGCVGKTKLIGKEFLTCLDNSTWSPLPDCASICSYPTLPKYLEFKENCTSKIVNETCGVRCNQKGKIIGEEYIKCLNENMWSPLPNCTCPVPILTHELEINGTCDNRKNGETCKLYCKGNRRIIGKDYLTCLDNSTWSSIPKCSLICSDPTLPKFLSVIDICSSKIVNETCRVRCNQNGKMTGNDQIQCLDGNKWTSFPSCTCPIPTLTDDLRSNETCDRKERGEKCTIHCKINGRIIGREYLICQKNRKWSSLPSCASFCPYPSLPKYLKLKENCTSKIINETCGLRCNHDGIIVGDDRIKCLEGNKWSSLPGCTCSTPVLTGGLQLKETCERKKKGENCSVQCRGGNRIIGKEHLICQENGTWSSLPNCASFCPTPALPEYLEHFGSCLHKFANETCTVSCNQGGKIVGNNSIECLNGSKWSSFPSCTCPQPVLSMDMDANDTCNAKDKGKTCNIYCKGHREVLEPHFLTCQANRKWSPIPECLSLCLKPNLPRYLILAEYCSSRVEQENCKVICANGEKMHGSPVLTCLGNDQWTAFPECSCLPVRVKSPLKLSHECVSKKRGDTCRIYCSHEKYAIEGNPQITCLHNFSWSPLPKCVCDVFYRGAMYALFEIESFIRIVQHDATPFSKVNCTRSIRKHGSITCLDNLEEQNWKFIPDCTCPSDLKKIAKESRFCRVLCQMTQEDFRLSSCEPTAYNCSVLDDYVHFHWKLFKT
ncbi:complement factor H-like [Parasteatoda tepidariorum]|uniref:complement factor H-like n=1 Tax=Parasteatoda tepidariorum TaxID=114398 RepID=UPI0039BD5CD8